jgi:DNA-binding sugar fermentation-stimulating protein
MWGAMARMGIDAVEAIESTQHRYLEQLRNIVEEGIEAIAYRTDVGPHGRQ